MPNDDAASKRRQRARNKAAGDVTRSGSSGSGLRVEKMDRKSFADIEDEAVHISDIPGELVNAQVLAGKKSVMMSMIVPIAYIREVMDMVVESKGTFTMARFYQVPRPVFAPLPDEDEGAADS